MQLFKNLSRLQIKYLLLF